MQDTAQAKNLPISSEARSQNCEERLLPSSCLSVGAETMDFREM